MLPLRLHSPGRLPSSMHKLGAYAVVALFVPGGTLIAFALWAFGQRGWLTVRTWRAVVAVVALGTGLIIPG